MSIREKAGWPDFLLLAWLSINLYCYIAHSFRSMPKCGPVVRLDCYMSSSLFFAGQVVLLCGCFWNCLSSICKLFSHLWRWCHVASLVVVKDPWRLPFVFLFAGDGCYGRALWPLHAFQEVCTGDRERQDLLHPAHGHRVCHRHLLVAVPAGAGGELKLSCRALHREGRGVNGVGI